MNARQKKMNLARAFFTVAVTAAAASGAPATQPAGDPTPGSATTGEVRRPFRDALERRERMGERGEFAIPGRQLSDDEIDQAMEFAQEHMPNFHAFWKLRPEGSMRLPMRLQPQFRLLLDATRSNDTELVDVLTRQMELRDEFFGLVRDNLDASPESRAELQNVLRKKTREMADLWLRQRELRIERMERLLVDERQRLQRDRSDPEGMVRGQFRRNMEDARLWLKHMERPGNSTQPSRD